MINWRFVFTDNRFSINKFWLLAHLHRLFSLYFFGTAIASMLPTQLGGLRVILYERHSVPLWVIPALFALYGAGLLVTPRVRFWQMLFWSLPLTLYAAGLYLTNAPATAMFDKLMILGGLFMLLEFAETIESLLLKLELSGNGRYP